MIHSILIAALLASQTAAGQPRCITRQEAGDIALNAAAIGLGALAERCRPHVGASAFLNIGGEAMLSRLRAAAQPRSASAFAAFARMSRPAPRTENGSGDEHGHGEEGEAQANSPTETPEEDEVESVIPEFDPSANPELMAGLVTVMAAAMINSLDTAICADADALFEALSPLPPENIARLAGAGLGIAGNARPESADSPLCPT